MSKDIFVSHADKDKEIAMAFVDLILHGALNVPVHDIFCTSVDGLKIKSGEDWRNAIKENLAGAKIIFLIITPNYKESEMCLCEMGAAWMTVAKVLPFIVEPISYKTAGIIQEPKQIEKLLEETSLDRIRDIVEKDFKLSSSSVSSARWTTKKKEFILRTNAHIKSNHFLPAIDRTAFNDLIKENKDLEIALKGLSDENAELDKKISDLIKAKDKKEVDKIMEKYTPTSQFQKFLSLCEIVKKALDKNASIINGIIFKTYSGKDNISISLDYSKEDVDEAYSNDFITTDLDANWNATSQMTSLKCALDDVSFFLEKDLKRSFYDDYENKFAGVPVELDNKLFWEKVFKASISFK